MSNQPDPQVTWNQVFAQVPRPIYIVISGLRNSEGEGAKWGKKQDSAPWLLPILAVELATIHLYSAR